jgi:hypothetical protein
MDKKQFEKEKQYRIAISIVKLMLKKGIISIEEYEQIDVMLIEKFGSILSGLYTKNDLIQ